MKGYKTLFFLIIIIFYGCTPDNPTPNCTFSYSPWSACANGFQTRVFSAIPSGCTSAPPLDSISRVCSSMVSNPGSGVSFNGVTYSSVVLGNGQEWMAENLRTTEYANGDPIPNVTDAAQWDSLTTGAWVYYNNDSQFENPYGKLYNWYTVSDPRNVCPIGWHVPSDIEWTDLSDFLGGVIFAGGKMKSLGSQVWQSPNVEATNESGFSGLPGGDRYGFISPFENISEQGTWWSSTGTTAGNAWERNLSYDHGALYKDNSAKKAGFSVRCLRD